MKDNHEPINNDIEIKTSSSNVNMLNSTNLKINNNSHQNQHNNDKHNEKNNNQANNNSLPKVKIHMIQVSNPDKNGNSYTSAGDSINTNNSIAIWYALKTTMDYLQSRSNKTNKFKQILDPLVKDNLESISSYLQKLGIDTTNIDELAGAFDGPANNITINNKINNVLGSHQGTNKSIEDLVFDELIKKKADKSNEIIDDKDKILLVKNDFDVLKQNIQKNGDDDIIDVTPPRNEEVFLSKAAKEFQDKVSKLDNVKTVNEQDQAIKDYNEAVKKLDTAIMEAVTARISGNRNRLQDGYHTGQLNDILKALGLVNAEEHNIENKIEDENSINIGKSLVDIDELQQFANKDGYIVGENESVFLNRLSEAVKTKLIRFESENGAEDYIQKFLPQKHQSSVLEKRDAFIKKFGLLSKNDQKAALSDGGKEIGKKENKNGDKNVNDLKAIANDEEIKKITLEYDEYNEFVDKGLFPDIGSIGKDMTGFLNDLLLNDSTSDEFKKAKGQLDGMVNKVLNEIGGYEKKEPDADQDYVFANLVLPLGPYASETKSDDKKHFVPTFIASLFDVNSEKKLTCLADNLNTLGQDKNFKSLLSNIMKSKLAVDMIKTNFEQTKKLFEKEGYNITRRGQFKKEFWDNNIKGHLHIFDNLKKKLAMLSVELLGGFSFGSALAGTAGVGLTAGFWPAVAAVAIIVATTIAVAVLVSLIMTLFKGLKDAKHENGFFQAKQGEKEEAQQSKNQYLHKIYSAFLTFGADAEKLKELVRLSKGSNKTFEKSSQGKFFKSMVEMKDFLQNNAGVNTKLGQHLRESTPFQILENINKKPPVPKINNPEIKKFSRKKNKNSSKKPFEKINESDEEDVFNISGINLDESSK